MSLWTPPLSLTTSCRFLLQEGPQDGADPDGLGRGGHRVPNRVPQPRPGREPPPAGLLLQVLHLSPDIAVRILHTPPRAASAASTTLRSFQRTSAETAVWSGVMLNYFFKLTFRFFAFKED